MNYLNDNTKRSYFSENALKNIFKGVIVILLFTFTYSSLAQVGIGNTNPQATLDISATSATSPASNDGILIPRMSAFPSSPGATRDGMLIYYTGTGASGKGFYYWNTTSWVFLSGAEKINELSDGKSDNDGSNDGSSIFLGINAGSGDDSSNNENIGIGYQALENNVTGNRNIAIGNAALQNSIANFNTAVGYNALITNTTGAANIAIGTNSLFNDTTGDSNVALGVDAGHSNSIGRFNAYLGNYSGSRNISGNYNTFVGNISGNSIRGNNNVTIGHAAGGNQTVKNVNGSVFIGYFAGALEFGSNKLYIDNSSADQNNALIYGEFDNNILRTNSEFQIGNPSSTGYSFPTLDGTNGQVLTTDGSGQINFTTLSLTDTQNTLDQAYDEGGAGAGSTINVDSGRVTMTGTSEMLYLYSSDISNNNDNTLTINSYLNSNSSNGIYIGLYGTNPTSSPYLGSTDAIENYIRHSTTNGITTGLKNSFVLGTNSGTNPFLTGFRGVLNDFYSVTNPNGKNIGIENLFSRTSNRQIGIENYFRANATLSYGVWNHTLGNLNSEHTGVYNQLNNIIGTSNTYGVRTSISGSSTGTKYGSYIDISSSSGGIHYGIFSSVPKTDSYAGYFRGRMSLGTGTINRYLMPETDGSVDQIIKTDGSGQLSFVDASTLFTTAANNGLNVDAGYVQLGGTLIENTLITQDNNSMTFNLSGNGNFLIQDNSVNKLEVLNNGDTVLGGDLYLRDENTSGDIIASITDSGNDGILDIYANNSIANRFSGIGDSYITGGSFGLGLNNPNHQLDVLDNVAGFVANFQNDNTAVTADGISIRLAAQNPNASAYYIGFYSNNQAAPDGRITGNGSGGVIYNTVSDRRLKTNIKNITNALNIINTIQPREYEYKAQLGKTEFGFIAQELQSIYPQAVTGSPDSDVEIDPMMVDYGRLTPILAAGIKELKEEVDALVTENAILKAKLQQLESIEARLSALENNSETSQANKIVNKDN